MKKIAVVLVIAVLAVYAMPVFADSAATTGTVTEMSLFQRIANDITGSKVPARFAVKPVVKDTVDAVKYLGDKKVTVFQDTSKAIAEGSAKAKNESAR